MPYIRRNIISIYIIRSEAMKATDLELDPAGH